MFFTQEQYEEEVKRWESRLVSSCKICNGVGSITINDGRNKMCSCMEKSLLNANLVSWGIPRKYLSDNWNWDTCTPQEFVSECKNYAFCFQNNYFDGKGLYLYGCQGRGKSTMEALIAKDIVMQVNPDTGKHYKVFFAIYEEIVQLSHQSRQDKEAKRRLDTIVDRPELLIIDNIGSETGLGSESKHSTRLLEFILRKRDNSGLPTMLSSNFTPEELSKNYSDTIHDFVIQNCELVLVTGDNFRKKSDVGSLLEGYGDENDW